MTAGNSSQINDGAAAPLLMSGERAAALGLTPMARLHSFAVAADDPVMMLTAIIPATGKVLRAAGVSVEDIDLFEVNEAFASVVLAWQRETGADLAWGRVPVLGAVPVLGVGQDAAAQVAADVLAEPAGLAAVEVRADHRAGEERAQ